jgi:hypothetical protein
MQWFGWFRTGDAEAFGKELGAFMVADLKGELKSLDARSKKRAEKTMVKAARRIQTFRSSHSLNFYRKSKLANAFLWTLKEAGWPDDYANQMTEWLTMRL